MTVIGIVGNARAGKDTCALHMKDYLENTGYKVQIVSLAYPIKKAASAATGLTIEVLDILKNENRTYMGLNIRQLYQDIGETFRRQNHDYFIENLTNKIRNNVYDVDVFIVSDVRYPNEIDGFVKLREQNNISNYNIKIKRDTTKDELGTLKLHHSESSVDQITEYDYLIDNASSMIRFKYKIDEIIKEIKWQKLQ
jgi:archaellum biogenesis ATPase FlaH